MSRPATIAEHQPENAMTAALGTDYDIVSNRIHCRADRIGAKVYEIVKDDDTIRVLAHSEQDAKDAV